MSHDLTIRSEWARSHSGQNFIGKCSCGEWGTTRGGSHQNYDAIIRDAHRLHVAEANATQEMSFSGICDLCGEPYNCLSEKPSEAEVGEFVDSNSNHVIAHAQCGIDSGLEMA